MPRAPGRTSSSGTAEVLRSALRDNLRSASLRFAMKVCMQVRAASSNGPLRLTLTCAIVAPGLSRPVTWLYQLGGSLSRGYGGVADGGAKKFVTLTKRDSITSGTQTSRGVSA